MRIQGIPMKQRTLPDSFWIPPETAERTPTVDAIDTDDATPNVSNIRITSPPDTNLLFSLFKILKSQRPTNDEDDTLSHIADDQAADEHNFNEDIDVTYDDGELLESDEDPYLYNTDTNVIVTKPEIKSNYSDLLSDLVVQL